MRIGAMAESFRTDFRSAVRAAKELGATGIQAGFKNDAVQIGMTPERIGEVRRFMNGEGMIFSALCGDFGCRMFYFPKEMRAEIEREKRAMELARELGTDVVTTHIGVVPSDEKSDVYKTMSDVCRELAEFADSVGGHFAVETGPEPADVLKKFLDGLGTKGVSVNLDPANLVMCAGDDPVRSVTVLKDYIVHTHAKDGIMLKKVDTRALYTADISGIKAEKWSDCIAEVPLGTGGVDFSAYLKALEGIGYKGYLTIEREVGENPAADIALAAKFLTQKLAEGGILHE